MHPLQLPQALSFLYSSKSFKEVSKIKEERPGMGVGTYEELDGGKGREKLGMFIF